MSPENGDPCQTGVLYLIITSLTNAYSALRCFSVLFLQEKSSSDSFDFNWGHILQMKMQIITQKGEREWKEENVNERRDIYLIYSVISKHGITIRGSAATVIWYGHKASAFL